MPVTCVLGTQWGDEGKAKVVDHMSRDADVVVRFQGGANAGHTVYADGKKHVFHMIPTGIIRKNLDCVVAGGVAFDPVEFFREIETLGEDPGELSGRLMVSRRAHLVLPYHKKLDLAREAAAGEGKIGTTAKGIGPAYSDKMTRSSALRVGDALDGKAFAEKLRASVKEKNALFRALGAEETNYEEVLEECETWRARLAPFIKDTVVYLREAVEAGKNVLLEGAQGAMLDVDFGTYPFVTSSNTTLAGAASGTGIPPRRIGRVIGITKVYTTRVGGGPFPTEDHGPGGEMLRDRGGEYGATTGRPRRCGWLDLVALGHSFGVSGIDAIALTKLDVLSGLEKIKVCVAYELDGERISHFPSLAAEVARVKPIYEELPGWTEDVGSARSLDDLPANAAAYVGYIEKKLGVSACMVSVGKEREAAIVLES